MGEIRLYDIKEVAEYLKLSTRTVQQYIKDGKLKAKKIGKKWIITEDTLREFVKPD